MKTYKVIRDIAIIIIALVALNQTTIIINNQNKLMHNQCVILENLESNVELSTVEPIQDTLVVLDTIIVPEYKTITRKIKQTVLDTVTITKVVDSINYFTVIDTVKISAIEPIKSNSTAIELEVNNNTFIANGIYHKLENNKIYALKDGVWVKPNKVKENRGYYTPHKLCNKDEIAQVKKLISSQHIKLAGSNP